MRVLPRLRRRVALRIALLFVGSSLLPLGVLAYFGIDRLGDELVAQSERRLDVACKQLGMALVDRLQFLEESLRSVEGSDDARALGSSLVERGICRSLGFQTAAGMEPLGPGVPELLPLDEQQEATLARTGALLVGRGARVPTFVLALDDHAERLLVAEIEPSYLWRTVRSLDSDCTVSLLEGEEPVFASLDGLDEHAIQYPGRIEGQVLGTWTLFLRPHYGVVWKLVLARPRAQVLRPAQSFRILFGLTTAIVLLAGTLVTLVLVRVNLHPIAVLKEAARRFSADALDERVVLETGDEFEELGDAFNGMAAAISARTNALRRANRVKDEFLANMSHEIRTPLTSILGLAEECLPDDVDDQQRRHALEVVAASGQHALRIVNDILDCASMQVGKYQMHLAPTPLRDLVGRVEALVRPLLKGNEVELALVFEEGVPGQVLTDGGRLQQVLVNLLSNAIKFTAAGRVRLTLSHQASELVAVVQDTGIGMSEEQLARVFEAFEQADSTTTRRYGGTGLGLTLSRAIAGGLGGTLEATSAEDEGSCFTLRIAAPAIDDEVRKPSAATARFRGRCLLAEDVLVNRRLIQRVLERLGLEVCGVEDGEQAVDAFREALEGGAPFDLVLLDLQMPVMDGHQALEEIKAHSSSTPVAALTAHCLEEERRRCEAEGFDAFETKPIDRESLVLMLARFLERDDGGASASAA